MILGKLGHWGSWCGTASVYPIKTQGKIFKKCKTIRNHEFYNFEKISSEYNNLKKSFPVAKETAYLR